MFLIDIISITAIVFTVVLLCMELKRDLMMLQQNSYRPERYSKWLTESGDSTSFLRLTAIFIFLFCMAGFGLGRFGAICVCVFSVFAGSKLAVRRYKKPVVFTRRATRIYATALILSALIISGAVTASMWGLLGHTRPLYAAMVATLFCYCISHGLMFAALFILSPLEKRINRRYYNDAARMLSDNAELKVIGITGSYGKTSTKHFLYRILSQQYETLMTPGSFNTTMGVIRTIREQLKPYHEVFIVEMGAKQPGDIRQICDLVHPQMGIITAVGPQHLQTFGSIENVFGYQI